MSAIERLPEHMREVAALWIKRGLPHPEVMGGFMRSILLNDLAGAAGNADRANREALADWGMFLWNDVPQAAWGNERKLLEWHAAGGLDGEKP